MPPKPPPSFNSGRDIPGWLADDAFRRDVDALLAAFRRRGGRVEYPASRAP